MAEACAEMDVQYVSERTRTGARLSGELVLLAPADWGSHLIALGDRIELLEQKPPEQAAPSGPG